MEALKLSLEDTPGKPVLRPGALVYGGAGARVRLPRARRRLPAACPALAPNVAARFYPRGQHLTLKPHEASSTSTACTGVLELCESVAEVASEVEREMRTGRVVASNTPAPGQTECTDARGRSARAALQREHCRRSGGLAQPPCAVTAPAAQTRPRPLTPTDSPGLSTHRQGTPTAPQRCSIRGFARAAGRKRRGPHATKKNRLIYRTNPRFS